MKSLLLPLLLTLALQSTFIESYTPVSRGCDERSCYPATGNLLIGRQTKLSASSTCGLRRRSRYCILSHLEPRSRREKCFWCDSTDEGQLKNPRSGHRIANIVYRMEPADAEPRQQYRTWWQAENGVENVTIQLDLEAEFHVTHLIITFKTFRPAAMYIEKSYDWGESWKITRYFAADCRQSFPNVYQGAPRFFNETVCQSRYSRVTPSTFGSVIYRVLPPNINIHSPGFNPYSKEVQDLLKTTNLRIHMTKLHTLGDENLETDRLDVKEKYYYSIYDMTVRGSCSCYGHAERCLPEKAEHEGIVGMVHGKCDCTHNTKGNNCEYCLDDHNDLPWQPATGKKKNECKKCNCHDHSSACTFNPYVFAATGNVSGGVCENCMHNTEGRQCEFCKEGFFQDPALDLNHPDICQQCDCDPDGTIDGGLCDARTDESEGLVAGQCHCKRYVGGQRCDRCLNGFWNFSLTNLDGCQECTCLLDGIVSDDGCDQLTGDCTCKRNVVGRDCDQCRDEHYGLSFNDVHGCKACDCDLGGAYDNNCDPVSGQCRCRPRIAGRRCDLVEDGFFTGPLDFLLFEAETAFGTQNPPTKVIRREPPTRSDDLTWTGFGFMQSYEGSTLTFDVPAIFKDLDYDLVIRYEHLPNHPDQWTRAQAELVPIDGLPEDKCLNRSFGLKGDQSLGGELNAEERDPGVPFSMTSDQNFVVLEEPVCLEEGKRYQIKLKFQQYGETTPDNKASILVDSIALLPRVDGLFNTSDPKAAQMIDAYSRLQCGDYFLDGHQTGNLPKDCTPLLNSISYIVFNGGLAKPCECDNTGSESVLCDKYTGQCQCKRNIVGRRCEQCAPGTYGFGADGCKPCNCHNQGSLDPFCRQTDGQCECAANAYGRRCNECQPGFFSFPQCLPCECNGHADTCDAESGQCIDCSDNSSGFHCEICSQGFYGDPRLEVDIPCRECPCPNTRNSGHSFADRCYLDTNNNEPVCECDEGYDGMRCSVCSDNFYGNPEIPGGSCVLCNCSNNWNFEAEGNCDNENGRCLKCLFNTEGDHCEYCQPGFFGDAVNGRCQECECNLLGTDPLNFECDRFSGQCHCLPNVMNEACDACQINFWKLASGEGCEFCDCDPVGSVSEECNVYDGQCKCRDGFGGRRCDQCEENFWGDPRVECYDCNCNPKGSQSFQCDHVTGKCVCLEGIGGEKCDECARGFVQHRVLTADEPVLSRRISYDELPQCVTCGECFVNYDRILANLANTTAALTAKAELVKVTGVTGVYTRAFEDMEKKLREVEFILKSASLSNDELIGVQNEIDAIDASLLATTQQLSQLDDQVGAVRQSVLKGSGGIDYLRSDADKLKLEAQDMKDRITRLQEANVEGALNLTREAKRRSDQAEIRVSEIERSGGELANSDLQRAATQKLMTNSREQFSSTQTQNQDKLAEIDEQISKLENKLPQLNSEVCDGETSVEEQCDELCGGAGCDKCGGLSCLNGAVSKAEEALKSAQMADQRLQEKDADAQQVLRQVLATESESASVSREAQLAYDLANEARNRSVGEQERAEKLIEEVEAFNAEEKNTHEDVMEIADDCLDAEMSLEPSAILSLATQINEAKESASTDVDEILRDTSEDAQRARELRLRAEETRKRANMQLEEAEKVTKLLSDADEAQNKADASISSAQNNIDEARKDLGQISSEMESAVSTSSASSASVVDLGARQQLLQTEFIKTENRVQAAMEAAAKAKTKASKANTILYELNNEFKNVSAGLDGKAESVSRAKITAVDLQRRANELAQTATNKLASINDVETDLEASERRLMELSEELVRLNCQMMIHLQIIEDKSNFYRTCSPPTEYTPTATCQCVPGATEPSCNARRRDVYY